MPLSKENKTFFRKKTRGLSSFSPLAKAAGILPTPRKILSKEPYRFIGLFSKRDPGIGLLYEQVSFQNKKRPLFAKRVVSFLSQPLCMRCRKTTSNS